jgi:hypothetical protein
MFNGTRANPFVQAALDTLMNYDEGSCTLPDLAARLAVREPLLSPFNLECAAREALRLWPDFKKAAQLAEEDADHAERDCVA